MRITIKGQVTIPQDVRNVAGLHPGTEVEFFIGDDGIVRVVEAGRADPGTRLQDAIARLRGSADRAMTTDEIMALTRD
ncbi:MAG TPA: AbrB/MazE/SpoVT family DNA-binding domain-containing protein [Paracoccus sp. (in: a-proteobacteria)]|uniref:AbrB/MazE/SpoVT family DNA-binding domain-containing protein n=1 Tax=Paracoccus sp. TaxID=267 RepID=UPI002BADE956|nr:AbrB/MazE/SpoVT family DNA-binding domain-containing protein [Paracoccus sp. (in: a-proteobacteria)]HWL58920.1 AbrB/MazE/SpoVT family DNA-binding domain-containing protein [Paracoccus sp. (in: a-proteobacteria)]